MKKKIIRATVFCGLLLLLLQGTASVLCVKSPHGVNQVRYLYRQPRNRVDVLFLGSSHVHCNVATSLLWEEHGIASYLCTSAEQPLWNSYHNLVEALKTQSPGLVVLDMYCPARFYENVQEQWLDQNLDGMRLSWNKWQAVQASTDIERMDFFLGFTKYHNRYDELQKEDFQNFFWNRKQQARWKGYTPLITQAELTQPDLDGVTGVQEMTEKSQLYFDKILELTKKEGIELALVSAPYLPEPEDQEVYNYIERIAEEEGILFLNYNTTPMYEEVGVDFAVDFADHTHLNEAGSEKYTRHLGQWLKENYEIPDRRGQRGYESWEEQVFYEEETAP